MGAVDRLILGKSRQPAWLLQLVVARALPAPTRYDRGRR